MKKIIYFLLATSVGLTSCNKFLDQAPDDRTTIDNETKIAELVASAYPKKNYITFAESMSDNAGDKGTTSRSEYNDLAWHFIDQTKNEMDTPPAYWNACYAAISAANHALDAIEKLDIKPEKTAASKGEALVARAYAHFMLVNFFAKPYRSEAEAATAAGIPYILKPETVVDGKYTRGTVKEVYAQIEKDLLEGLELIDNSSYKVPSYHFNKNAAYAFATRFYLFKKDYNAVVKYANSIMTTSSIASALRPWNTTYSSLGYYDLQALYTNSTQQSNLLLAETNTIWGRSFAGYNYGLNTPLLAEILGASTNPLKLQLSYRSKVFGGNETVYNIPKFYENFIKESISANYGEPYNSVPLFTMEEVLFNRAEANANLGMTDLAIADINAFLSKRIASYSATNANHKITLAKMQTFYPTLSEAEAVVETVLNFKRQEFLFEGMRWFDIIRLGKTVKHVSLTGSENIELGADDPRRVMQLPKEVLAAGLEPNER